MKRTSALVALAFLLCAPSARALPFNTRPVTGLDGDLQNFFNTKVAGAGYNAVTDQSQAALFTATGNGIVLSFAFSALGSGSYSARDVFGIYSPVTRVEVPLFSLQGLISQPWPIVFVAFTTDGSIGVFGPGGGGVYSGFGPDVFGYYVKVGGQTRYTEDDKNGGQAWALTYQGHGGSLDMPGSLDNVELKNYYWLTAFETLTAEDGIEGKKDFDDLILVTESITPVPEPATMLLLGSGLLGLARVTRKRKT